MKEKEIIEKLEQSEQDYKNDRVDIPMLKYFYQASPLSGRKTDNIPKFLRSLRVLKHFTDYELKVFSSFTHERKYKNEEVVFKEGDTGYAFYFLFQGSIDIFVQKSRLKDRSVETYQQFVASIGKGEYLGELALLEQQNKRNATAISKGNSTLLAIYKPDIEEMIERHPVIGAKFLQAISLIIANRFISVTEELQQLKEKCNQLEARVDESSH